jgi:uncharacterized damage-inducible protein DinB
MARRTAIRDSRQANCNIGERRREVCGYGAVSGRYTGPLPGDTVKKRLVLSTALLTLMPALHALGAADDDPLSTYLRRSYAAVSKDVTAAVEMMAEADLGFRPAGVVEEVRTFGQIALHLAQANDWVCSVGDGKPPAGGFGSAVASDKVRLLAALKNTDARCTAYLATLRDAALAEVLTTGPADRRLQTVRGSSVVFAIAHANEHYGNLVTYLRARGLVPPPAASQASFLSPVGRD